MCAQSLENELMQYWPQLSIVQQESILSVIKSIIEPQEVSIEQYNKEIDEAMTRIDAGQHVSHEEVVRMSKKWTNAK